MKLETLSQLLGSGEFRPMNRMEHDTWGGCNPGTYIADEPEGFSVLEGETYRVWFAEPNGDVAILQAVYMDNGETEEEVNFNVGPLEGFDADAVTRNAAYHAETERLRGN